MFPLAFALFLLIFFPSVSLSLIRLTVSWIISEKATEICSLFPLQFHSFRNKIVYSLKIDGMIFFSLHCSKFQSIIISVSAHWTLNAQMAGSSKNHGVGFLFLKAFNKYLIGLVVFVLDWFDLIKATATLIYECSLRIHWKTVNIFVGQIRYRWLSNNDEEICENRSFDSHQNKTMRKWVDRIFRRIYLNWIELR